MDFDTDYAPRQVAGRTRAERMIGKDWDAIEKSWLAAHHEHHEQHTIVDDIIKPEKCSSMRVDDVDRFNCDYAGNQRATNRQAQERQAVCTAATRGQQVAYHEGVEVAAAARTARVVGGHDFNADIVDNRLQS